MDAVWIGACSAPVTALVWGAVSVWINERTRKTARQIFSEQIKAALATFKLELLEDLNGPNGFKKSELCALIEEGNVSRLEKLEKAIDTTAKRLEDLWLYSHQRSHEQAQMLSTALGEIHMMKESFDKSR
jgi:hypothetical protein